MKNLAKSDADKPHSSNDAPAEEAVAVVEFGIEHDEPRWRTENIQAAGKLVLAVRSSTNIKS